MNKKQLICLSLLIEYPSGNSSFLTSAHKWLETEDETRAWFQEVHDFYQKEGYKIRGRCLLVIDNALEKGGDANE